VANGSRSSNIAYAGTTLEEGTTYYWRIKFWDSNTYKNESDWSETAQFTMNYTPVASASNITGDEDIYPGKTITLQTIYSDQNGATDLDKLYLQIKNPAGTDIEYYISSTGSNQTNQFPTPVSGAQYISGITYDTAVGSPTANDISVTWHITTNWSWTRGTNLQYGIRALDRETGASEYEYVTTEYKYENRLTFEGNITVIDSGHNPVAQGDWTPPNQTLTFSGVKVVYLGSSSIYPLDSDFDVKITNEESSEWTDTTSTGENIAIDITTSNETNIDDTYTLTIINIPTGGEDASSSSFSLKTDHTNPSISSITSDTHPNQSIWYTDTTADFNWVISDNESGIQNTWYIWDSNADTDLVNTIAEGTPISGNTITIENIQEGTSYLHIATKDNCGNTAFSSYTVHIDNQNPVFESITSSTHANQTHWYSSKSAIVNWVTSDLGSGIHGVWALINQNDTATEEEILSHGTQYQATASLTTPELTDGIWYLHLIAKDISNKTASSTFIFQIDSSSVDIIAVTGSNDGILQNTESGPVISWTNPNSISGDIFYITNDGSIPNTSNYAYFTTSSAYDLPSQKEGETIIKVRALNGAGTYSESRSFVIKYDSIAPTNVSNFTATAGQRTISLAWRSPSDADFSKVILVRSNSHVPLTTTDGTKIYEGTLSTYSDTNLSVSTRYYYTIFALDTIGNQSSGTLAQATTPAAAVVTTQPTTPTQPEPEPVAPVVQPQTKIIKIQDLSDDQKITITTEDKQLTTTDNGKLHTYANQTIEIEIPASTIIDNISDLKNVVITVNNQTYNMTYDSQKNTYKATIDTPSVKGTYNTTIQAIANDNSSNLAITMFLLVDPYGYVYTKDGANELRILNAKVTLYTKNGEHEVLWQPKDGTTNPQYTNQQGEYQFFVTPGEYKLVVEVQGYVPTETEWFTVESNIVEKNIEMKRTPYLWYGIIAGIEVAALIGIIYFTKRRKKRSK
jgi:hypothetical protein